MKPLWNPTIKTLVKNLEYIRECGPCPMDKVSLSKVSYKWYWNFKQQGWLNVTRSRKDGRSHLVSLTSKGEEVLVILKKIEIANYLLCHECAKPIDKFFKVPNDEWTRVTGNKDDQVICRDCYNKMKAEKGDEHE